MHRHQCKPVREVIAIPSRLFSRPRVSDLAFCAVAQIAYAACRVPRPKVPQYLPGWCARQPGRYENKEIDINHQLVQRFIKTFTDTA